MHTFIVFRGGDLGAPPPGISLVFKTSGITGLKFGSKPDELGGVISPTTLSRHKQQKLLETIIL